MVDNDLQKALLMSALSENLLMNSVVKEFVSLCFDKVTPVNAKLLNNVKE
mgnify:CR=1 FL=1